MSRKKPNPAKSLKRFMYGIFDYYYDRGMPQKTAKARMIDNTLEECVKLMKQEQEIPDEMLVVMAQWMSHSLYQRGSQITNEIKSLSEEKQQNIELTPLKDIKEAKDAIDLFIKNYKGWSELDEQEKDVE